MTLESFEHQPNHFFHTALVTKRSHMSGHENADFDILFELAGHGRPGPWILHHEEMYHLAIDTRPQTRNASEAVIIRDKTFKERQRSVKAIPITHEPTWGGDGQPPDSADNFDY